jgi:predicted nucleic acid-binding protein
VLLVDTSIWVLAQHGRFDLHAVTERLCTCPAVMLEALRGTPNRHAYDSLREVLLAATLVDDPTPFTRFEEAALLYLRCRDAGVTVRSSIDCLVAATALAHDVAVFHDDRDFEQIKRVVPLRTVTRSSTAARS